MPNRLATASSPYHLQHKDNPVDWREWGEEAFAHESFEDDATAARMSQDLVSVKVDREEHPDVDSACMTAVRTMTALGGPSCRLGAGPRMEAT